MKSPQQSTRQSSVYLRLWSVWLIPAIPASSSLSPVHWRRAGSSPLPHVLRQVDYPLSRWKQVLWKTFSLSIPACLSMLCTVPALALVRPAVEMKKTTQAAPGPGKAAYKTHGHRNGSPKWNWGAHSLLCCSSSCSGNVFGTTQELPPFPVDKRTQWETVSEQKWPSSPEPYQRLPHSTKEAQWLGGSPALPTPVQLLRTLDSAGWFPRSGLCLSTYVDVCAYDENALSNRLVCQCV